MTPARPPIQLAMLQTPPPPAPQPQTQAQAQQQAQAQALAARQAHAADLARRAEAAQLAADKQKLLQQQAQDQRRKAQLAKAAADADAKARLEAAQARAAQLAAADAAAAKARQDAANAAAAKAQKLAAAAPPAPTGETRGFSSRAIAGGSPVYPSAYESDGRTGRVTVSCLITERGSPTGCHIVSSQGGVGFNNAVLSWLHSGSVRFAPILHNGEARSEEHTWSMTFEP